MKHIRQLTQKGDPVIRIQLPETVIALMKNMANKNKRRIQDQFIKSLSNSFEKESELYTVFKKLIFVLNKAYQLTNTKFELENIPNKGKDKFQKLYIKIDQILDSKNLTLQQYAQVISVEMIEALKKSSQEKMINLDMEVALRLIASFTEPAINGESNLLNQIMHKEFTEQEAVAECKRKRESNHYLYEMEKLRLFLRFEKSLPRNAKESFTVINVKEATKIIKAELEEEDKQNNQGE